MDPKDQASPDTVDVVETAPAADETHKEVAAAGADDGAETVETVGDGAEEAKVGGEVDPEPAAQGAEPAGKVETKVETDPYADDIKAAREAAAAPPEVAAHATLTAADVAAQTLALIDARERKLIAEQQAAAKAAEIAERGEDPTEAVRRTIAEEMAPIRELAEKQRQEIRRERTKALMAVQSAEVDAAPFLKHHADPISKRDLHDAVETEILAAKYRNAVRTGSDDIDAAEIKQCVSRANARAIRAAGNGFDRGIEKAKPRPAQVPIAGGPARGARSNVDPAAGQTQAGAPTGKPNGTAKRTMADLTDSTRTGKRYAKLLGL